MLRKVLASFFLALVNIRSHFFHTMLSVLGMVIGVAALVGILSMIDGMEQYARDQITQTTSLKTIIVRPETGKRVNGITIRKDSVAVIGYQDLNALRSSLTQPANVYLYNSQGKEIILKGMKKAAMVTGLSQPPEKIALLLGTNLDNESIQQQKPVAVVTKSIANLNGEASPIHLGDSLILGNKTLKIIGIADDRIPGSAEVILPITLFTDAEMKAQPPQCIVEAENVEQVLQLKKETESWFAERFPEPDSFSITTNDLRVQQATRGFLLFRVIMGLIVGISVLVGGIGVMNVLLISVTERTAEIGIRKAVGASRRDILLQFLSESIVVSSFGSFVGLLAGLGSTLVIVPIVRSLTEIPFRAVFTWDTLIVVSVLAVVVGIVFGTYPALRAARLDPVEAIRKE